MAGPRGLLSEFVRFGSVGGSLIEYVGPPENGFAAVATFFVGGLFDNVYAIFQKGAPLRPREVLEPG